jgi:hypothetical protein
MGLNPVYWAIQKKPDWYVNVDVLGVKEHDARVDNYGDTIVDNHGKDTGRRVSFFDPSIVVEVSMSSDLKKEIRKLRNVKANVRLVVTADATLRGEVSGIPVIPYNQVNSSTLGKLKETFWCDKQDCEFNTHERKRLDAHSEFHKRLDLFGNWEKCTTQEGKEYERKEYAKAKRAYDKHMHRFRGTGTA